MLLLKNKAVKVIQNRTPHLTAAGVLRSGCALLPAGVLLKCQCLGPPEILR